MTLVAIAMDRYLLIVRYKKKKLSTKQSLKIIVIIWFLSQVPSSPLLLYSKTYRAQVGQDEYKTKCFESWPSVAIRHSYSLLVFLVFYFIPLSVISWMYIKIVRKLRNALPESRKGQCERLTGEQEGKEVKIKMGKLQNTFILCLTSKELQIKIIDLSALNSSGNKRFVCYPHSN